MPWMQAKMHGICHHNSKASEKVAFTTKLGGNVLFILPLQTSVEQIEVTTTWSWVRRIWAKCGFTFFPPTFF